MEAIGRRSMLIGGALMALGPARAARADDAADDVPAPINGQGYHLAFADEFTTLDVGENGHRWTPHLWYERPADPEQYGVAQSVLTLKLVRSLGSWRGCNLATEWADTRDGTFFRGGYFEARMKVPHGWPAFWLFSVNHSRGVAPRAGDPASLCAEIDVYEGDSARPTYFCGALHRNTGNYGGMPDQYNHNNCQDLGQDLTQGWHLYSVLWTPKEVVWYLDRKEAHRAPAFDSTWQKMFLVLSMEVGGVLNGPPPAPDAPAPELHVDWVRVWTKPEV